MSIEGIRKGYLFCQRWYVKGKGVGGKVCGPSSYNTLLSAPLAHYGPQREAVCSFAACYCHILCFLLFFIFNWNASIVLASKSSVRSSTFTNSLIIHVTRHMSALDQLKHSCTINRGGSSFPVRWWNLSTFVQNLQTSSCFYKSGNHGVTKSSHQVFNYVAVTKS